MSSSIAEKTEQSLWKLTAENFYSCHIANPDDGKVWMYAFEGGSDLIAEHQNNAAYIVKACNAYPKLVEALKAHRTCETYGEYMSAQELSLAILRELGEL